MLNKKQYLFVLPLVATFSLHANDTFFNDPFGDDIFKEMMQMQENMDEMFHRMHQRMQQRTTRQIAPLGTYKIKQQNDFIDKGASYEFITNIPKSKENEIDIRSEKGIVSITAKIIEKKEQKTANGYSTSSSMRMYQQRLALPEDANESSLGMAYTDGYLVIMLEKNKSIEIAEPSTLKKEILEDENVTEDKNVIEGEKEENNTSKERIKVTDDASMT